MIDNATGSAEWISSDENERRADRGDAALSGPLAGEGDDDRESELTDAIADLMHAAGRRGMSAAVIKARMMSAWGHYDFERDDVED